MEPSDHLFRREAGRMVATRTRVFGVHTLALAEDVVQDAFCQALEVWKFRGVPENPSAWLMATARNRALDILRRERTARKVAPELARQFLSEEAVRSSLELVSPPGRIATVAFAPLADTLGIRRISTERSAARLNELLDLSKS